MDFTAIDLSILHYIEENIQNPILTPIMLFFSLICEAGLLWISLCLFLLLIKKSRKSGVLLGIGIILSFLIVNLLIKSIVSRPRPYTVDSFNLLIKKPFDSSFPSAHTTLSFASAGCLSYINKKHIFWVYPVAIMIGLSRLYFTVHFPTDVLSGALIGTAIAVISILIYKLIEKKTKLFEGKLFR